MNTWVGFCWVVVAVPSPKSHDQDVADVDVSVNATDSGAVPDVGDAVKLADGAGTVTLIVLVAAGEVPALFEAVKLTR